MALRLVGRRERACGCRGCWGDEPLKRDMLPTRMRLGLRALRTELACVRGRKTARMKFTSHTPDTRPRPQAGAVCVREKTQGHKHEILLRAMGRGEPGSISLERAQGNGGGSPRITCAGTALNSKSEKRIVKSSTNTPVMQGAKQMHIERRCDCELPRQSCRLGRACVDF